MSAREGHPIYFLLAVLVAVSILAIPVTIGLAFWSGDWRWLTGAAVSWLYLHWMIA